MAIHHKVINAPGTGVLPLYTIFTLKPAQELESIHILLRIEN